MKSTVQIRRPTAPPEAGGPAIDRLVADMVARWRLGERPPAEEYLDRHPALWDRPDEALELIAEELVLRAEFREPVTEADLARRFPKWPAQVRVLLECQRALGAQLPPVRFPGPGDRVGDFHLLSELGRGAHGRAFLAAQPALAGRPVVLKLGPADGREHLSLARLQHTHIVPLYSVHEFPEWGLRGLCLPYFGGATLADLYPPPGSPPRPPGAAGPVPDLLHGAQPWEVVCRVGVCLADALQYAHDRGLLHLDLKPSNVLIAADGTPMLLDFHLARGPLRAGDPAPAWLGGTPASMPPEQRTAMEAVAPGRPVPADLDARADVYALGLLLGELWDRLGAPGQRRSVGLADMLARATAHRPADRYPTAGALGADLRRHLMALPLKGVGNRSLSERWEKWRRRRPLALPLTLALAAVAAVSVGLVRHVDRQVDRAQSAVRDAETYVGDGRYAEAAEAGRTGEIALDGVPFHTALRLRLADVRAAADRAQAATDLRRVCDQVRPLYAAEVVAPAQVQEAVARCREVWGRRDEIALRLASQPTAELEQQWPADLLDLGILTAHLEVRAAPASQVEAARHRALATLAEAEASLGPSPVLYLERARHARALGMREAAEEAERRARGLPAKSGWEHLAIGRSHLAAGDMAKAAAAFERCLELDPRSVWGHFYAGVCRLRSGQATEAVAAFSACLALRPDDAWCAYNRGLAYAAAGRFDRGLADFDRALARDGRLVAAYLGRADVHRRAGRPANCRADPRRAAASDAPPAEVEYRAALLDLDSKDRAGARSRLRDCLTHDPGHAPARELLARFGGD